MTITELQNLWRSIFNTEPPNQRQWAKLYHSGVQCTDVKELCAKNVLPAMLSCANRSRHSPWDLIGKGSI